MLEFLFGRKKDKTLAIEGVPTELAARPGETLLQTALREGLRFPNDCRVGGCGTCKCKLLEGKVHERTESAYVLSAEELASGYVLACQSVPKSDVRIALDKPLLAQSAHPVVRTQGIVASRRLLTHDVAEVVVRTEAPLRYTAGQYARLTVPSIGPESRSYSFARACTEGGRTELTFFVRVVPGGMLSPFLALGPAEGIDVDVEGPFGDFGLASTPRPILAITGGSGLAPILALLEDAAMNKCDRPVVLLFGARTQRDLYALEAIDALRASWLGRFEFVPVLSHETHGSGWQGERGMVTSLVESRFDAGAEAYLCGPPPMIDAAILELTRFGMRDDRIHFDKFLDRSHLAKKVA